MRRGSHNVHHFNWAKGMMITRTSKQVFRMLVLTSITAALTWAEHVSAAPLEADACANLTAERAGLVSQGVEGDMAKGAQWARQNLPETRLSQIKRLIEVNEQLSFRCGLMVTARPSLIVRTPTPAQTMTSTSGDPDQPQKKQTKSKPKPASATPPAGTPGAKPKPAQKQATTPEGKPVVEAKTSAPPKPSTPEKQAPTEKTAN